MNIKVYTVIFFISLSVRLCRIISDTVGLVLMGHFYSTMKYVNEI